MLDGKEVLRMAKFEFAAAFMTAAAEFTGVLEQLGPVGERDQEVMVDFYMTLGAVLPLQSFFASNSAAGMPEQEPLSKDEVRELINVHKGGAGGQVGVR